MSKNLKCGFGQEYMLYRNNRNNNAGKGNFSYHLPKGYCNLIYQFPINESIRIIGY